MRTSKLFLFLSTAMIGTSVFMACHKRTPLTTDTGFSNEQATAEKSFEDAQTASDQASTTPNGSMSFRTAATTSGPCATVSRSVATTGTFEGDSVLTIDFGITDCVCMDGSIRRGQIVVYYSGAYAATGSTHTITFNNFYQNDNQVIGTKTVINMGQNSLGQTYFSVIINGSVILADGAGTISAVWTRVRTWITQGKPDVYQITGTGSLTRPNGNVVTVNIPATSPLVVASNCRWIEAGTAFYTLPSGLTASLDYGAAAVCDAEALLTYNGKTYNITLK